MYYPYYSSLFTFGPNIPTAVAFCLGTEVLRHSAGIVGTYDRTTIRMYVMYICLIIFIANNALYMLKR